MTDPPYYGSILYSDLADFFYVWLQQSLRDVYPDLFAPSLIEKTDEAIATPTSPGRGGVRKDAAYFESSMTSALVEARRVLSHTGVCTVVFAHKSTSGWEAMLNAMIDAGWMVTASWPIDTERQARTNAQGTAALASSVHLVCRPRDTAIGGEIGDWREVLRELPIRMHEWMPRLAEEGVVGADAIFACLGPALEIFSRYARVEKASGDEVKLKEYLEHVWAAVAREALSTILRDTDAGSLEPDARLVVMWLWTLGGGNQASSDDAGDDDSDDDDDAPKAKAKGGYVLEYDAARKIAQGLGARLEDLTHVVEVKGDIARLLPVGERSHFLFGKVEAATVTKKQIAKKRQGTLFEELEEAAEEQGWGEVGAPHAGATTLDRVHQAMLLFATGRGEALKRFLVDDGAGNSTAFWKLAQSLSALYPGGSEEKRWVDGVLARKKGLGFG